MLKNMTAKLQQILSSLRAKVPAPIVCPNCGERITNSTPVLFHKRANVPALP